MNLYDYYDKWVKIEDVGGNIIKGRVFNYEDGDEEDEDSEYYLMPSIDVNHVEVIKGNDYNKDSIIMFYEKDIKSIEIIK